MRKVRTREFHCWSAAARLSKGYMAAIIKLAHCALTCYGKHSCCLDMREEQPCFSTIYLLVVVPDNLWGFILLHTAVLYQLNILRRVNYVMVTLCLNYLKPDWYFCTVVSVTSQVTQTQKANIDLCVILVYPSVFFLYDLKTNTDSSIWVVWLTLLQGIQNLGVINLFQHCITAAVFFQDQEV